MGEISFYETRLVVAHLLHQMLRLGHGAFGELPFMQAVEVIVIVTAIFLAESKGEPFKALASPSIWGCRARHCFVGWRSSNRKRSSAETPKACG